MSPAEDKEAKERRFNSLALPPQSPDAPDAPDAPRPLENALTDLAGRRRFADFVRRAGSLLDPDPERFNNKAYQGRYRTYPRTPGEEHLNPYLHEHEQKFYEARRAGHSRSQLSLVMPGSPSTREPQASGSGSHTPRPEGAHHGRSDSGGSQFLEVPWGHHRPLTSIITESIPQPPSLLFDDNSPTPRITIT